MIRLTVCLLTVLFVSPASAQSKRAFGRASQEPMRALAGASAESTQPATARAPEGSLALRIEASQERMRVDGALSEWKGAHFVELGSDPSSSLRYALAEADHGLYLAAELRDDTLVSGDKGDLLLLNLAMPDTDQPSWTESELALSPGEVGKSKARVLLRVGGNTRSVPQAQIVEGPRKSGAGYVVEAFIPWTAIPGAQLWEQGRGKLRFVDVDGKAAPRTVGTSTASGASMPRLGGAHDLLSSFVSAQKLEGVEPRYDFRSDVSGDPAPERVVIVDRYVLVYGPGYKRGESSNFFALPYELGGGLKSAALLDLTGDGHSELLVTVRQQNALGSREAVLALSLADERMAQLFGLEQRKEVAGGFVEATVSVLPPQPGKPRRIELKSGRALGLDASSYRETAATDLAPILLPWGELESQRYQFDGAHFVLIEETRHKLAAQAAAPLRKELAAPPQSAVPGQDSVLARFKSQQKLPPDSKPTRSLRANVLPGSADEQIDVFGSVLVLTGPDVGEGTGWLSYNAPVQDARDLLDVRAADVTADGRPELLLRVRQPLGGADGVQRELLLVLRADEQGRLARVLGVEVARSQGEARIDNRVLTQAGALLIEPGKASGWSQSSYPFTSDAIAGVEVLLLPWKDGATRYRLSGARLLPVR